MWAMLRKHVRATFQAPSSDRDIAPFVLPERLNHGYTFDSFVVADCNREAAEAARAVAEKPGQRHNPLYIYGPTGMGATHLLQAIYRAKQLDYQQACHLTSERFTTEFVTAIVRGRADEFRQRYRSFKLLLVDDIQFLANRARTHEEFLHIVEDLTSNGCQVVVAGGDRQPDPMSLFARSGLAVELKSPDYNTRLAILRAKAREKGVQLRTDVAKFLADRAQDDVRGLVDLLNRVIAYARLTDSRPTVKTARSYLASLNPIWSARFAPDVILRAVGAHFSVSERALAGSNRSRQVTEARRFAMYVMRTDANLTLMQIASILHRVPAEVLRGVQTIERAAGPPIGRRKLDSGEAEVRQTLDGIRAIAKALSPGPPILALPTSVDPDSIVRAVAAYFNLSERSLAGRHRSARVAQACRIAMYLLREDAELYWHTIAYTFAHRDRFEVKRAIQRVCRSLNEPAVRRQLNTIRVIAQALPQRRRGTPLWVRRRASTSRPSDTEPEDPRTVVGLRGWRWSYLHDAADGSRQFALRGLYGKSVTTRTSARANCGVQFPHRAPAQRCQCGFFAVSELRMVPPTIFYHTRQPGDIAWAIVRVSAVGRTVTHELGWRSERIRIDEIWAPDISGEQLEGLRQQFEVPVHADFPEEACNEHW
jgi:chromosomal replication initiator protein